MLLLLLLLLLLRLGRQNRCRLLLRQDHRRGLLDVAHQRLLRWLLLIVDLLLDDIMVVLSLDAVRHGSGRGRGHHRNIRLLHHVGLLLLRLRLSPRLTPAI